MSRNRLFNHTDGIETEYHAYLGKYHGLTRQMHLGHSVSGSKPVTKWRRYHIRWRHFLMISWGL